MRVDRIELSKNLLRGFHAYDLLLEEQPEWRERVVFAAFVYPSREGLPEYLAYRNEVEDARRPDQRAVGDADVDADRATTPTTTSRGRSPPCSAPTCCSSTRSATG